MKKTYQLGELDWKLAGCTPHQWQLQPFGDIHEIPALEITPIPAVVPGSVQKNLLTAGILLDWNQGTNTRHCEWVENRHWLFQVKLPEDWIDHHS